MPLRDILVRLHRWVGLTMAAFLVLTGLTGSLLAFKLEIDAWLNDDLFHGALLGEQLTPGELVRRVEAAVLQVRIMTLPLQLAPGENAQLTIQPRIDPTTGKRFILNYNQIFADPISGEIVGRRDTAGCCSRRNFVQFVYELHYTLMLDRAGRMWLGVVGLLWALDCFVGFYLTLPRGRPFFVKWMPAWCLKTGADAYRVNLDIHRTGGLWLWPVLFVVAVTSFYFGLPDVFRAGVNAVSPLTPFALAKSSSIGSGQLSFDDALDLAGVHARERGWQTAPHSMAFFVSRNFYGVSFGERHPTGLGNRTLLIDGRSGREIGALIPGEGSVGDVIIAAQLPLHGGQIAGLPGRILVSISGVVTSVLAITGVYIWLRKRRSYHTRRARSHRIST